MHGSGVQARSRLALRPRLLRESLEAIRIAVGVFIRVETAADPAPRPGQQRCWRPAYFPVWSPWQPLTVQDALPGTFIMSLGENFINTPHVSYRETIYNFLETSGRAVAKWH